MDQDSLVDHLLEKLKFLSRELEGQRELIGDLYTEINTLRDKFLEDGERYQVPLDPAEYDARFSELHKENQLLNQLIKQYESTLEIVMGKFRAQTQNIARDRQELHAQLERAVEEERFEKEQLRLQNLILQEQVDSCFRVIREAVRADEEEEENAGALVSSLMKENETLRTMLKISGWNGELPRSG